MTRLITRKTSHCCIVWLMQEECSWCIGQWPGGGWTSHAGYPKAVCQWKELQTAEFIIRCNKSSTQVESVPIIAELGNGMKEQYNHAIPKRSIGNALGYSIERWKKLSLYTEDGMLNMDNHPVENSIRPVALGRKSTSLPYRMQLPSAAECYTVTGHL